MTLRRLDLVKAVELGLADAAALHENTPGSLSLDEGKKLYLDHLRLPKVAGGARPKTVGRYRAVMDKAIPFFQTQGIATWNQVKKRHLENYAAMLDGEGYAYRTEFLELTTLKQAIKYLIAEGHLPADCQIRMPLPKPSGTDTYCWHPEEVRAIIEHCRKVSGLGWLGDVLTALACTGMRISELSGLRRSDIEFESNMITLKDESRSRPRKGREGRSIKNAESRSFPINKELLPVLESRRGGIPGSHVFTGPNGEVLKPDVVRRALISEVLNPLADRFPTADDEVGFRDGRLHSFRHHFCSMCSNQGTPEQMVMRWLGHKSSSMVKLYYHLHDDQAQRQMEKLDFIGGLGGS